MVDTRLDFSRPEITDDDVAAVTRVLRSGWLTTGAECAAFEHELAEFVGAEHVVCVSSATAAQEICMAYLDLPPGSRVGIPTWTFASTGLALHRSGLEVVLLDVEQDDLNLSPDSLVASLEGDGLSAVVGVHFAGKTFSHEVRRLCSDAGVPLVEDAAHALGAGDDRGLVNGRDVSAAFFSFYTTKNLTTGEGGAIATTDEGLAQFARTYRLHGMTADAVNRYRKGGTARYDVVDPGIKANMPDLLAALGRSQLARYGVTLERRRAIVDRYRAGLNGLEGVRFAGRRSDSRSANHLAVIVLPSVDIRDEVAAHLRSIEIGTSVHFTPLHALTWFRNHTTIGIGGLPTAEDLYDRTLSLPLHVNMSEADVGRVVEGVREAVSCYQLVG